MKLVKKEDLLPLLINSTLEDLTPVWDSNTTYNKDEVVQYKGYIYKSLIDNNTDNPENGISWINWDNVNNRAYPVKFPNNKTACFDYYTQTQSVGENEVVIEFKNNFFNYIGGYNIQADKVKIEVLVDMATMPYDWYMWTYQMAYKPVDETILLTDNPVWDWYDWTMWMPVDKTDNFNLLFEVHPFSIIKVTFYGNNIKIGTLEAGILEDAGCTLSSVDLFVKSSKQHKRDEETGVMFIDDRLKGGYEEITANILIDKYKKVDDVLNKLKKTINIPTTFIVDDRDNPEVRKKHYTLFGIIEEYKNTLSNNTSEYSITIKGV